MTNFIDLVPDYQFHQSGIIKYIRWEYDKHPHLILFGSTGSGKTYLLKQILGRIGKYIQDSEIILCDFKADDDFTFLKSSNNFYRFDECTKGLERALQLLQERQQGKSTDRHFITLVFDEWASYLNHLDKKSAEQAKQILSTLLMLGRSFGIHVFISQQRADSSYFNSARDNFSVIVGLGVLSKESVEMMYKDYKDIINPNKPQGHGSLIHGNQFHEIIVPTVYDRNKLHFYIQLAINRCTHNESH